MSYGSDLILTFGINDREFIKSLERSGGYAKRTAWQILRDFERAERAKERLAREQAAKHRRNYQRIQAAHQVMTVAIAAGAGVMYKAFEKAAESNRDLRHEMELIRQASDSFFADLGNDLSPFLGGLDSAIDRLGRMRRAASDFVAMFAQGFGGQGKLYEINYQLEAAARGRARFEDALRGQDIEHELFGDDSDPDRRYRRDAQRRIGEVRDPERRAKLRERLNRQLQQRADDRQRSAADAARQRSLDAQAAAARARAARDPENYEAQREAINADAAAQRNRVRQRIDGDDTIPDAEKAQAVRDALMLISAEQARQLELAQRQNEEQARRKMILEQEQRIGEAQQRVDLARAQGRDSEADAMQLAIEYERRRLAIINDQNLSIELRDRMLANEESIFNAGVARLGRGRGDSSGRANVISAGFAGDALTAAQSIGIKGEVRQMVNLAQKANQLLEQIRDKNTAAVVG